METGTVKWFDSRKEKRYGFLRIEGEKNDIFFHFNDGETIIAGKDEPVFSGVAEEDLGSHTRPLRDPREGDVIKFIRTQGAKGVKACPWGYKAYYDSALYAIAHRPAPTVYRALETMNAIGDEPKEPKVLWEGDDLDEFLKRFPLPRGNQSPSADPLLPFWSDPDGIFETRHWVEKKTEKGWEECPDPRPLSGANRQFERISRR